MTTTRQEALSALAELSELAPDVRLGQLVTNLSYLARGLSATSVWDVEDDEFLSAAKKHLEQWRQKKASGAAA